MTATVFAFFLGQWEWLIILGIALLFFGNRIPGMARSLGLGIVEFRKGLKGEGGEKKIEGDTEQPKDDS